MLSQVLIIDTRKELSTKYKRCLDDEEISAAIAKTLKDAISLIRTTEPDLIIVSDSIAEELTTFCQKIRTLTYNTRPTIVALSKSADFNDRINVLNCGADDFISEPVNIKEFQMRIKAHLRRDIELNSDNVTLLPNKKYVQKALKRLLNSENKQAVLLIGVENLTNYKSLYSDVAGDKLLQTLVAIAKSAIDTNDFLGRLNENNFIIITSPYSAEKMAAFLTFAFDTVAPKFYSVEDTKRGYTLMNGDREAGMRANFVSVLIGGILDNYDLISTENALLEKLFAIKKMAKVQKGSNYAIDRIKISGENSIITPSINNKVYIKEPDEALSFLLKTALQLQGYEIQDDINLSANEQPRIIILDSLDDLSELDFCKDLKMRQNFVNTKIIVTSTTREKTAILNAGADLYLPKPYEVVELIRWVEYFT